MDAIEAYKKDVDRSLLRANLRLTPQERMDKFASFMAGVMELHEAGKRKREAKDLATAKIARPVDESSNSRP